MRVPKEQDSQDNKELPLGRDSTPRTDETSLAGRAPLAERIRVAQQNARRSSPQAPTRETSPEERPSDMAAGLKLSSEFVAGVLLGAGIGWFLDRWMQTSPLFLILFLGLGTAAGVVNVVRASAPAGNVQATGGRRAKTGKVQAKKDEPEKSRITNGSADPGTLKKTSDPDDLNQR